MSFAPGCAGPTLVTSAYPSCGAKGIFYERRDAGRELGVLRVREEDSTERAHLEPHMVPGQLRVPVKGPTSPDA
jgi:hypothetical protein